MKSIFGTLLITAGCFIYMFIVNFDGSILSYTPLWLALGIIVGYIIFVTSKSRKEKIAESRKHDAINRLKQLGKVIKTSIEDCELISNDYFKEIPKSGNLRVQGWDSLYDSSRTVKNVEIYQTRIVYKPKDTYYNEMYMSPIINKDKETLSFIFPKNKEICIYVDRDDRSKYYFDIDFLKKQLID
jgi:hypothetical protein